MSTLAPARAAALHRPSSRAPAPTFASRGAERALSGVIGPHQRKLLATQLRHIRSLDGEIASLSRAIAARQQPHEAALTQLQTIPGADPPAWVLGFQDETWWSRLARPALQAWAEPDQPLRLVEQTVAKTDPDPKALACYGLLVRWAEPAGRWHEEA